MRAWIALLGLMLVVALTVPAAAQGELRVVDVQVVGNRIATPSLILGVSSIDKGSPLTSSNIQETIRRLYGLGMFSDVKIEAEEVTGGLKVYLIVKELPKLSGLEFLGNKEIKTKDLNDKLKLGVGGYISPYLIHQKKEQVRQLYAEKGYFQARVEPTVEYNADSTEAKLTYRIDERSKVKVEQVVLTGNKQVPANDLIKKMRNRKRGFLKSSDFAQEKYEEDLTKVIEEYHKKGFIDAYVISDSTHIDTVTNRMTVYLDVYEGPRYYFGETTFKGNEELKSDGLKRVLKHKPGEVFNAETYDESLMQIYQTYQEIGHLHVRVNDERTTRADSVLDITYDITEGLPSHINLVKIVGNTKTKDKVIRREITALPGQRFSRAALVRSIRDVMALNYFSNVEPAPVDLPNGDVDLEFKVEEKQTGQISAGAGYNSQDKLVGQLGLGIPNLFGNGQSLNLSVERGNRRNSFSLSFTEPWLLGRPTLFGTDIYTTNRRWFEDYTEGRRGGSVRLGRRLRWPDNYFRVVGGYRLEGNRFYDFDSSFVQQNSYNRRYYLDRDSTGTFDATKDPLISIDPYKTIPGSVLSNGDAWRTSSSVSLNITRDSRNLPEFATSGSIVAVNFENYGNFLGGYWSFQKYGVQLAKFIPLVGKLALAAKVQFGAIADHDSDRDDRILLSERFTPGGTAFDGIVRGYDDGSLTPDSIYHDQDSTFLVTERDSTGKIISSIFIDREISTQVRVRGNFMLVSNVELQIPLAKQQLYGLVFFDAGNSWLNARDIKPFSGTGLYKGAGVGFRIVVPGIGTIGFDFAYPLDKREGQDQKWRPHFQIGTTFR